MRVQMRTEITKLHQRLQATMIYVTHDQIEAMTMGDRIVVMKDGLVQQIDAPLALYNEPKNLFVAGFLGSPPMNFVTGKLKSAPGDAVIFKESGDGVIEVKLNARPAAKAYVGKEVVLGIRPESIEVVKGPEKEPGSRFQAVVDLIEPMGAETNFYLQTGAHTVTCRSEALVDHREAGHRLQFDMNTAKAHLFDPETTNRIV
jgi:multiple sugar transport system ATP-binding protein